MGECTSHVLRHPVCTIIYNGFLSSGTMVAVSQDSARDTKEEEAGRSHLRPAVSKRNEDGLGKKQAAEGNRASFRTQQEDGVSIGPKCAWSRSCR